MERRGRDNSWRFERASRSPEHHSDTVGCAQLAILTGKQSASLHSSSQPRSNLYHLSPLYQVMKMLWLQNLLLPLILSRFQSGEWPVLITFSGVHVLSVMVGFLTQSRIQDYPREKQKSYWCLQISVTSPFTCAYEWNIFNGNTNDHQKLLSSTSIICPFPVGNAGDSLTSHSGMRFSTKDQDNDISSGNCAKSYHGAWWYSGCHASNLNGRYLHGSHGSFANGINWHAWKGHYYSAARSEMKIRPVSF